ncbi:hypothetical protein RH915_05070 [Serpentinicella sp. ANB-PHB4]|uniref:hypothetical protein n=1 Tax=Serpentinicella sp. ANB-PHB4 TaxID=3074076 RepID=UPI002861165D|nr:hypothetical protein [Serpentinicella sp. ANB-PHB4]MDR5658854.1 hypothetical protein [Serpentinicella sp. ANB-PHB4]
MVKNKVFLLTLILILLIASGCSKKHVDTENQNIQEKAVLYENIDLGFRVFESSQWNVGEESTNGSFNVTFENNKLKAIVTILTSEKSVDEIKNDLKTGTRKANIIQDTKDSLIFESERKESIRTEIYIKDNRANKGIITFMTPVKDYENNKDAIDEFRRNLQFF